MAAFIGGPIAAVYVLRTNFEEMGRQADARWALIYGLAFIAALFAILPFLPEKFPNVAIPVGYSVAVGQIVEYKQLSKNAIRQSGHYEFQSNWRVMTVSAVSLVLVMVLLIAWMLLLAQLGVISLEE
ncbi:MAG TPA: hypothetical protein VGQ22_09795 [Steroidobacteraceae bacterium]|jgi:hypothetical protein|nr:hypothetical protein [Steroidobacteraceae bacterium]